jgi:enolase-phosphatase E1
MAHRTLTNETFVTEAEAATQAGVHSVVVDRPGNAPLTDESKAKFAVIQKLIDLP